MRASTRFIQQNVKNSFPPKNAEDTEIRRKKVFRRHSVVSVKLGG
jgi:hypothetical protein